MDFIIKDLKESIVSITRAIGYTNLDTTSHNEFSMVRKITGSNYPRFHVFIKQRGNHYYFNLHLDQKQPSYQGSHAHSGEYDSPVVEDEADRIKDILNNIEKTCH